VPATTSGARPCTAYGEKAYLELTTLLRAEGGGPLVQGSLRDAALLFYFAPDGRPRPFQLDAVARRDRKDEIARLAKPALKLAADIACMLRVGGGDRRDGGRAGDE
jgi:hypothetical protein